MIKRQFYRIEHADRDDAADSSSSSDSDAELEGQAQEESEDEAVEDEVEENGQACSTSSGYASENSSADEMNVTSLGVINEDDAEIGNDRQLFVDNKLHGNRHADATKSKTTEERASVPADFPDCVLQIKSVFRCRICPRILCLSEETTRAHLNSKGHARSEKLLKENRLKAILNDDGEIENQETAAEMNARIVALVQDKPKAKNKRRQRKRNLPKEEEEEKVNEDLIKKKAKQLTRNSAKKRRKSEN